MLCWCDTSQTRSCSLLWNCITFWNTALYIKMLIVLFISFYKIFLNIWSFENGHQYIFSLAGYGVSESMLHSQLVTSSWLTVASKGCLWMQQSNSFPARLCFSFTRSSFHWLSDKFDILFQTRCCAQVH